MTEETENDKKIRQSMSILFAVERRDFNDHDIPNRAAVTRFWNTFGRTAANTTTDMWDTTTSDQLQFAWVGGNTATATTAEFADIGEFRESEPGRYRQWRYRVDTDTTYREEQYDMQRRLNNSEYDNQWRPDDNHVGRFIYDTAGDKPKSIRDWIYKWKTLMKEPNRWFWISKGISDWLDPLKLNRSMEEIALEKAEQKSDGLLKQWLTRKEYKSLKRDGYMEVASQEKDTIYIIKKDPLALVDVKKKGKVEEQICIHSGDEAIDMPTGDKLLLKILLCKTDEKKFNEIGNKHNVREGVYELAANEFGHHYQVQSEGATVGTQQLTFTASNAGTNILCSSTDNETVGTI